MQVEQALPELGHLGEAAGDGDLRNGMAAQIFQHAAGEIAHVDAAPSRAGRRGLHRLLGGAARRARDMSRAPRRARRRCRDGWCGSRPSRNRARRCRWCRGSTARRRCRAAVERLRRHLLAAAGWRSRSRRRRTSERAAASAIAACIISRGTGLIAGSPGGMGRPGTRHRADARRRPGTCTPLRPRRAAPSRRSARHA